MLNLTIDRILDCLDANRQRATYEAVAEALGNVGARNVRLYLMAWNERHGHSGDFRGPKTSWVVYKNGGWPAGYDDPDAVEHPDLYRSPRVLETGEEIRSMCIAE